MCEINETLYLNVHFKVTKAGPFLNSSNLIIHATDSSICPIPAMTKYLDTTTHNNKPLLIFCSGSPKLTDQYSHSTFRWLSLKPGLGPWSRPWRTCGLPVAYQLWPTLIIM